MSRIIVIKIKNLIGSVQRGDTLVEVMISIAVVALAIAISYAISGKNLNVGINARERTQAVALVQGQIESMTAARQLSGSDSASPKDPSKHFCFDANSNPVTQSGIDPVNNSLNADQINYLPACISDGKLYLDINYVKQNGNGINANGNSFAFTARWYRLGGGPDQIVTIYYRPW